jgi:hypothetical protein
MTTQAEIQLSTLATAVISTSHLMHMRDKAPPRQVYFLTYDRSGVMNVEC